MRHFQSFIYFSCATLDFGLCENLVALQRSAEAFITRNLLGSGSFEFLPSAEL
jgi:hypothetical protein